MSIKEKIDKMIEEKSLNEGIYFPSEESVTIRIELTEEEKEEFKALDLSDNYWWEIEGNALIVSYTEN